MNNAKRTIINRGDVRRFVEAYFQLFDVLQTRHEI
jgi:hypothetical protein